MEVAEGVVERELEVAEFEGKNSISSRRPAFLCLHSPRLRSAPAISTPIKSKSDPFERHCAEPRLHAVRFLFLSGLEFSHAPESLAISSHIWVSTKRH